MKRTDLSKHAKRRPEQQNYLLNFEMDALYNVVWSEKFWCPNNRTWKDFTDHKDSDIYLPQAHDLIWSLPFGVLLLLVRYIVEL